MNPIRKRSSNSNRNTINCIQPNSTETNCGPQINTNSDCDCDDGENGDDTENPCLRTNGGKMRGDLVLVAPAKCQQSEFPHEPSDLCNKKYVDSKADERLSTDGGTVKGDIHVKAPAKCIQSQLPSSSDDLCNKEYVDESVSKCLRKDGGTLDGNLYINEPHKCTQYQLPTGPGDLCNKQYVDEQLKCCCKSFLPLKGGTMSGPIVQPIAPKAPHDLANKEYVDSKFNGGGSGSTGTFVKHSDTVYSILGSNPGPTTPISMLDYAVTVKPGQTVKINYAWNYQSSGGGAAYAPSLGWSGVSPSDLFQAHAPVFNGGTPKSSAIFATTPPDYYTQASTAADTSFNQSFVLTLAGINGEALPINVNLYFTNEGAAETTLVPLFNRDLKSTAGVTIQIAGGWMDYTFFN